MGNLLVTAVELEARQAVSSAGAPGSLFTFHFSLCKPAPYALSPAPRIVHRDDDAGTERSARPGQAHPLRHQQQQQEQGAVRREVRLSGHRGIG